MSRARTYEVKRMWLRGPSRAPDRIGSRASLLAAVDADHRGLLGVRLLGVAAAIGLALFFTGAVATHVRARAFHNIAVPGIYLGLAISCAVVAATVH
jgi:DoxX-like family